MSANVDTDGLGLSSPWFLLLTTRGEACCQERVCGGYSPAAEGPCCWLGDRSLGCTVGFSLETPIVRLSRRGLETADVYRATWGLRRRSVCTSEAGVEPQIRQLLRGQQPGAPEPGNTVPRQTVATGFLQPIFRAEVSRMPRSNPASPEYLCSPSSPEGRALFQGRPEEKDQAVGRLFHVPSLEQSCQQLPRPQSLSPPRSQRSTAHSWLSPGRQCRR